MNQQLTKENVLPARVTGLDFTLTNLPLFGTLRLSGGEIEMSGGSLGNY